MSLAEALAGVKISLFLNHRCNLRCRYCYNQRHFDRAMPLEVARQAIDLGFEQAGAGFLLVHFTGGEPLGEIALVEKSIAHALATAARQGRRVFFSLSTNATLLDDRCLRVIKANHVHVQVSLDGCRRAQDANRLFVNRRSTYPRAAAALVRLIGDGAQPRVLAVVDPSNVRYLVDSFHALKDLGAKEISFVPNLHAAWNEAARAQLAGALARLADAWAKSLRAQEGLTVEPFQSKLAASRPDPAPEAIRCGFGKGELAVSPLGRIYPCDRLIKGDEDDALCLGDLESGLDLAKHARLLESREQPDPECEGCEVRQRCAHSCGCANWELTGDPSKVSPTLCWFERTVIAQTDRAAASLRA